MTDHTDTRAELAFRSALAVDDLPAGPTFTTVQRRARQRRIGSVAAVGFVLLAVLAGGFAVTVNGIARPDVAGGVTGRLPVDPAPAGWRTDYYRDMSFQVPAGWGYVYQPAAEECRSRPRGIDQPYVAQVSAPSDGTLDCSQTTPSPEVDHVRVVPREEYNANNTDSHADGRWTLHRITPETDLMVTTSDEALARQIVASIRQDPRDTPCRPHSALEQLPDGRPTPFDLSELRPRTITGLAVCEYDTRAGEQTGLRASRQLAAVDARAAVAAMLRGSARTTPGCTSRIEDEFSAVIRIEAAGELYDVDLTAGCGARTSGGTFDDGTTRRLVTHDACRALIALPISLPPNAGAIAQTCNG